MRPINPTDKKIDGAHLILSFGDAGVSIQAREGNAIVGRIELKRGELATLAELCAAIHADVPADKAFTFDAAAALDAAKHKDEKSK